MIKTNSVLKIGLFSALLLMVSVVHPWQPAAYAAVQVRITEIMYDPSGNGDREFIEFHNGSNTPATMGGWSTFGVDYVFPAGFTLGAGNYVVIARNSAALSANNPGAAIAGQYNGKLKGSGELIRLMDSNGSTVSQVSYAYAGAWPSAPRNGGPSLSLISPTANETLAGCWGSSTNNGGSPSAANSATGASGGCSTVAYAYTASPTSPTTATTPSSNTAATPSATSTAPKTKQEIAAEKAKQEKEADKKTEAVGATNGNQNEQSDTLNSANTAVQQAAQGQRNRWLLVAMAAVILAVLGVASWFGTRWLRKRHVKLVLAKGRGKKHETATSAAHH